MRLEFLTMEVSKSFGKLVIAGVYAKDVLESAPRGRECMKIEPIVPAPGVEVLLQIAGVCSRRLQRKIWLSIRILVVSSFYFLSFLMFLSGYLISCVAPLHAVQWFEVISPVFVVAAYNTRLALSNIISVFNRNEKL